MFLFVHGFCDFEQFFVNLWLLLTIQQRRRFCCEKSALKMFGQLVGTMLKK